MPLHRRGRARAIGLEKRLGHFLEPAQRPGGFFRVGGQPASELRPAGESVLPRQRMLDVSQGRLWGRLGNRVLEARARVGQTSAKRVEPGLGFLLQALEAAPAGELVAHGPLPPSCLKSAETRPEEGSEQSLRTGLGGRIPLPRTGGAPTRTGLILVPKANRVKRQSAPQARVLVGLAPGETDGMTRVSGRLLTQLWERPNCNLPSSIHLVVRSSH